MAISRSGIAARGTSGALREIASHALLIDVAVGLIAYRVIRT